MAENENENENEKLKKEKRRVDREIAESGKVAE